MSPKYNILNFTESYRKAEHRHTILLPVAMGLVVLISFGLVVKTRPTVKKENDSPVSVKSGKTTGKVAISAPPKIDLNIDFERDLGSVPVIDPGIKLNPDQVILPQPEKLNVPVARVIKAKPLSRDGLPLISPDGSETKFTSWMTPTELNEHILSLNQGQEISFWDRGHWIVAVEGRSGNNRQEYRIVYEKTPKKSAFQWRYRIAQSRDTFARNMAQLQRDGFELIQSQAFDTPDGTLQYQAVWQKFD